MNMPIAIAIGVSLVVAWRSFHFFFDDFYAFLACFGQARGYRNYYLRWNEPQEWSHTAAAYAKITLYLALAAGTGFLTCCGMRRILGDG